MIRYIEEDNKMKTKVFKVKYVRPYKDKVKKSFRTPEREEVYAKKAPDCAITSKEIQTLHSLHAGPQLGSGCQESPSSFFAWCWVYAVLNENPR
jgi:hypothetical protein